MPSAAKVRWAQLRVGLMALAAMGLLGALVFLLSGSKNLFATTVPLYTYLDDSAALAPGAPVRLNGFLIGKVATVELSGSKEPRRVVRVRLEVREDMLKSIPVDSAASIAAENVLGTKFINIKMGRAAQAMKPESEVPSLDTREFDEVVQSGYALMTSLQGIINRIDTIVGLVEAGKGSIGKLLVDDELYNRLLAIETDIQKMTTALSSGRGTIGRLLYDDALYEEIRSPVARLDSLLEEIQQGRGTAGKLLKDPKLYDDLHQSVLQVRTLLADLNAGKGTAGKLLKTDEMHKQISGTLAKVDTTLDRMNSGQGTIGQLMVNPQLYESINGLTGEMRGLMKDFRANPKKFLSIKLGLF